MRNFTSPENAFAYILECQMATYECLTLRKRTSDADLRRHSEIIRKAFIHGFAYLQNPEHTRSCARVNKIMGSNVADTHALQACLVNYFNGCEQTK